MRSIRDRVQAVAVAVTRATRAHEATRQGSSVRGAIDLTLVAGQLFNLDPERLLVSPGPAAYSAQSAEAKEASYREASHDWEDHFILDPAAAPPG